jgi:hypothetical protein
MGGSKGRCRVSELVLSMPWQVQARVMASEKRRAKAGCWLRAEKGGGVVQVTENECALNMTTEHNVASAC